jgi:S-DNA-T family DNA segregation ATPase FtsK/SpoIIIE
VSGSSAVPGEGTLRIGRALREAALLLVLALGVALLLALASYSPDDPGWTSTGRSELARNWLGALGAWVADALLATFGVAAFAVPLAAIALTVAHWRGRPGDALLPVFRLSAGSLGMLGVCLLGAVNLDPEATTLPFGAGGLVGLTLLRAGLPALGVPGLNGAGIVLVLIGVTLVTGVSWPAFLERLGALLRRGAGIATRAVLAGARSAGHALRAGAVAGVGSVTGALSRGLAFVRDHVPRPGTAGSGEAPVDVLPIAEAPAPASVPRRSRRADTADEGPVPPVARAEGVTVEDAERRAGLGAAPAEPRPSRRSARERQKPLFDGVGPLPRLDLLDDDDAPRPVGVSRDSLAALGKRLELKLKDFGVDATVVVVNPGPVITRFEIQPAPGVKVSKISGLAKDLARSLAVISVRIVEVIPGKSTVGIEIPNEQRELVRLRAVLSTEAYEKAPGPLALALGKDIAGHASVVNLAKMPHLLVAGTTGSGKSVGVNAMLLSLLYKATAEEVRLIMVDPEDARAVGLRGHPAPAHPGRHRHEGGGQCAALVCGRDGAPLQAHVQALACATSPATTSKREGGHRRPGNPSRTRCTSPTRDLFDGIRTTRFPCLERLPYIVVCIDELADMMMMVGKKVEAAHRPPRPEGPGRRHPPAAGHAAPVGGRAHRPDQGQHPDPHGLQGLLAGRLAHHPRPDGGRAPARPRRHALPAPGRQHPPRACTAPSSTTPRSTAWSAFLKQLGPPRYIDTVLHGPGEHLPGIDPEPRGGAGDVEDQDPNCSTRRCRSSSRPAAHPSPASSAG